MTCESLCARVSNRRVVRQSFGPAERRRHANDTCSRVEHGRLLGLWNVCRALSAELPDVDTDWMLDAAHAWFLAAAR